ncbi:MAG: MXAN_5187 C-terminal domain-containing protein [Myxococcota bacterium]|nr:MXAN_5187 C-terminal domain-containing protein [Myxococcota bacterium]
MRVQLTAVIAVIFSIAGVAIYVQSSDLVTAQAVSNIDAQLLGARQSVVQRRTLREFAILGRSSRVAAWPQLVALLQKTPADYASEDGTPPSADTFNYKVHQAVYEEVLVWTERFNAFASRKKAVRSLSGWARAVPAYFVVVDKQGTVVADASDAARYGMNIAKQYPSLEDTLKEGQEVRDVWWVGGAAMTVGAVPIRNRDKAVLGGVIIGYRLNDAEARREKGRVQADVAYLVSGKLRQSSSLAAGLEPELETVFNQRVTDGKTDKGIFSARLKGQEYRVMWGRLSGYESADAYMAVLKNQGQVVADARARLLGIPLVWVIAIVLAIVLCMVLVQRYTASFVHMDQGVLEIINGNLDYWFEPDSGTVAKNMAQNLNIMVCHLSGRPLPDEEDDAVKPQHWVRDQLFVDSINDEDLESSKVTASVMNTSQMAGLSAGMIRLIRDDDESYQRKTFKDYVDALEQTGEPMGGLTLNAFVSQLEKNAAELKARFGCSRVRFLVEIEDGRASLKPVPMD